MSTTLRRFVSFRTSVLLAALLFVAGHSWALHFDHAVVARYVQDKHGERGVERVSRWFALLRRHAGTTDHQALLVGVNAFWNGTIREGVDRDIWKQEDYWATPVETLVRGMGDCEDFVIGKYFSLVHLGVPPDRLRLIYVRARVDGQSIAHMVLGYYTSPEADPLILDNLRDSIQPASQRRDLTPVFSFNADAVYVAGSARSSVDRISRWKGLLLRMQQEGFKP